MLISKEPGKQSRFPSSPEHGKNPGMGQLKSPREPSVPALLRVHHLKSFIQSTDIQKLSPLLNVPALFRYAFLIAQSAPEQMRFEL